VKPTDYDAEVRGDLLRRLSLALNMVEPGTLKAFGSFAAGLYLPSGDMDLVFLCRGYKPGSVGINGLPAPPSRSLLNKFSRRLRETKFAIPDSVTLIPFAKVPM
jgi:non-canonical poly(A) RNA polymerase PAPD5/7